MKIGGPLSECRFILTNPQSNKLTLIGYANGTLKVVSLENLKSEHEFIIGLDESKNEELTVGVYNPNGVNFSVATNLGNVFFGSIKEDQQGNPKVLMGKIDQLTKDMNTSITSMQFSVFDPIGSLLVAFSNGTIKTW